MKKASLLTLLGFYFHTIGLWHVVEKFVRKLVTKAIVHWDDENLTFCRKNFENSFRLII